MVKTAVDESLRPKIKPDDVVPIGKPVAKLSDQMAAMVTGRDKTDDGQPIMSPQIRRDIATPTDLLLQKAEDYIEDVNQTENPIQAVLYANMLTRGKMIGNTGIQIPGLNLDENIKEHRDAIIGFFKNAVGREDYDPRDIAWCAAFVDATLTKIGADRLNPGVKLGSEESYARVRAREYVNYGEAIELSDIKEGDLIVLDFDPPGTPGHGIGDHVGFYPGDRAGGFPSRKDEIKMLGGNQGGMGATIERSSEGEFTEGAVSIKNFDLENVLSVRRITRDSKPWEGVKDENPLFFYEKKGTPGYGMQKGGLTKQMQSLMLPSADNDYTTNKPKNFTARDFASDSWEETKERFMDAGKIDVDPEDPALFTAYKRSIDYLKDMGLSGLSLADTAFKYAVGAVSQAMPTEQLEKRMARDLYSIPEAFAGMAGARSLTQLDDAADAFMAGSRKALDTAKRVEVDPNAVGMMGGNIRLKSTASGIVDEPFKKTPTDTKLFNRAADVKEAERLIDDPDALKAWQKKEGGKGKRQENPTDSEAAAEALYRGDITSKEARKRVGDAIPPPKEYTADEVRNMMPTVTDVTGSMGKKAKDYGILGVKGFDLKKGQLLGTRLDIPAYNKYDKWVVSIHDGGTKEKINLKGSVLGYGQAIRLKNVRFGSQSKEALDIARGKILVKKTGEEKPFGKSTIARAVGEYVPEDPYELQEMAASIIESGSKEWTQVGMNPYRGSQFYGKKTGKIVFDADEMIQVGPLVLAKNVKTATISDLKEMAVRTKDGKLRIFNEGGVTMNRQMQMAFMQQGGLKDDGMKVDPVSGNQIPPGSMAKEVRDDIPAQLSEGEYVVPADVVQYYGVKHFEDLRNKAKGGLGQMERDGRIGGEPVPVGGPKAGQPPMTQAPMPPAPKQMAMGGPLSGEEMQELQRMANGGVVQMADPYQQQKSMYQQPQGMSLGGSPFMPNIGTGFSWEATGPGSITPQPQKPTTLYGPNGEVVNLILPQDQERYDQLISQGYKTTAPKPIQQPTSGGGGSDSGSGFTPEPKDPWYKEVDFNNVSGYVDSILTEPKSSGIFGLKTPVISLVEGIDKLGNVSKAFSSIELAKAAGKIDDDTYNKLKGRVDKYAEDNNLDPKLVSTLASGTLRTRGARGVADIDDDGTTTRKELNAWMNSDATATKATTTKDSGDDGPSESQKMLQQMQDERRKTETLRSQSPEVKAAQEGAREKQKEKTGGIEDTSNFGGYTGPSGGRNKGGLMQRK